MNFNEGHEQRNAMLRDMRITRIRNKKWYDIRKADINFWDQEALRVDARWNPELAYAIEQFYGVPAYSKGKPFEQILDRNGKVIATPTHWHDGTFAPKPVRHNQKLMLKLMDRLRLYIRVFANC